MKNMKSNPYIIWKKHVRENKQFIQAAIANLQSCSECWDLLLSRKPRWNQKSLAAMNQEGKEKTQTDLGSICATKRSLSLIILVGKLISTPWKTVPFLIVRTSIMQYVRI